jgi:dTDP-4-amino-4,6-dideoxygalactose transaminase
LRTHGITRDPAHMQHPTDEPWYYELTQLGYNYRMTDIQAALGASQMGRIDAFIARRNALAERYTRLLAELPVTWQEPLADAYSAFHLFVIRLAEECPARFEVFDRLRAAGIGVNVHYIPVHLQPLYRERGFGPGDFPSAEAYYERAITLPLYPTMTDEQQDEVVRALASAVTGTR